MLWQRLVQVFLVPLNPGKAPWGKGCSFMGQEQYAPFNLCGHDTSLELEQIMNF